MDARRRARPGTIVAALTLAAIGAFAPGSIAVAKEPNGHASCIGLEQASISPPGSSDEEPGGARQFVGEVKELAATFGVPTGGLMSFIARLHAGSHAACDEALEG
jgi:hypothetical protein